MKKAFYFFFTVIAVAMACNKVDEPSSVLSISCWPTRIMEIDTFADITDTTITLYKYDSINRLISFSTFDEIDSLFYQGETNRVTKRNYYSLDSTLQMYDTYIYDMFGRIEKVTTYSPFSKYKSFPCIYKQKKGAHKEMQLALKALNSSGPYVLDKWVEFSYASINSKYPSLEKDYTVPNTWTAIGRYILQNNNIIEAKGYDIIKKDTILVMSVTATYDRYNNIYKSLNCGTIVIDKAFSDNNILTQILITGTGKDRDSTNSKYTLSYNEYNYPTEIRLNDKVYTTIEYKIDSAALKKQLGQ